MFTLTLFSKPPNTTILSSQILEVCWSLGVGYTPRLKTLCQVIEMVSKLYRCSLMLPSGLIPPYRNIFLPYTTEVW